MTPCNPTTFQSLQNGCVINSVIEVVKLADDISKYPLFIAQQLLRTVALSLHWWKEMVVKKSPRILLYSPINVFSGNHRKPTSGTILASRRITVSDDDLRQYLRDVVQD